MVNDDDKLLIERYLAGSLPDNEHRTLRARLETDTALGDYFLRQREMQDFLARDARVTSTLAYLNGLEQTGPPDRTEPLRPEPDTVSDFVPAAPNKYWLPLGLSALIVLITLLLFYFYWPSDPPAVIEHRPLAVMMADAPPPEVAAYNAGEYAAALPLLVEANAARPNPEYQLAIAISYLETDRPAAALPYLEGLAAAPLYGDARHFYGALAYWQMARRDDAAAALNRLSPGGYYAPAAERLRARMEKK